MASMIVNPWRAVKNISIRTRPFIQPVCAEQRRRIIPASAAAAAPLVLRRAVSTDTTSQPPSDDINELPASTETQGPEVFARNIVNAQAIETLERVASGKDAIPEGLDEGLLFQMPPKPGKKEHLKDRYDPVVHQVTRALMRDGKLGVAQRRMAMILNFLRTSPSPKVNPNRPLLPGAPPPSYLPLDPVLYLTLAIDSVAPLIRIHALNGMGGGGRALELPAALSLRVRRRYALKWIFDVVTKKKSRGSGRTMFAHRFANEIVAIIEGRSAVWDRRNTTHKLGTAVRANLNHPNAQPGAKKKYSGKS